MMALNSQFSSHSILGANIIGVSPCWLNCHVFKSCHTLYHVCYVWGYIYVFMVNLYVTSMLFVWGVSMCSWRTCMSRLCYV